MSSRPPNPPQPPEGPLSPGPDVITAFRVQRNWMPRRLPSGRVEYAETLPSWRAVFLTREQYQREQEEQRLLNRDQEEQQQREEQQQASPAWVGAETPRVPTDSPQDEWMGRMRDEGSMREDDGADAHARTDMDHAAPSRAPTPFSGPFPAFDHENWAALNMLNDHPDIEQPAWPASASGTTDDGQQPPAGTAAETAGSPEAELDEDKRGRHKAKKQSRGADPPVEGRRKSSRKRTKTQRLVEEGGVSG